MKYSIIGFPRIGIHRELKFETEKYFRNEITQIQYLEFVREQRALQWNKQLEHHVSFIPSNDYSLYDGMLDTTVMLNAIEKRYLDLNVDDLKTYFSMARGYQGKEGDVKAHTMKKWFNTNYHYMVPELEDDTCIKLRNLDFLQGYKQAKSIGIETKPVIIGPYTFLDLAKVNGTKDKKDYVTDLKKAYIDIIEQCHQAGVVWLQIDEPSLVKDMDQSDVALFVDFYQEILKYKGTTKILLQTYFGDVRDCYHEICGLNFDGLGLDFVEGKQTYDLVKQTPLPKDKILFAGLINGKNIWKANYQDILRQLKQLSENQNVILNTSCSLLHVPYTIENETQMDSNIKKHFSFAYEKLKEMDEICQLFEDEHYQENELYIQNQNLFKESVLRTNQQVQDALKALKEDDFIRQVPRSQRRLVQKEKLNLPLLPTTTIGSFPQTKEVKQTRFKYKKGKISYDDYCHEMQRHIKECIELQEKIGLDVLVHGEFERNDMVEYFGQQLQGYVFTENGWVQSYGTRGLKPPIIFSDIKRVKPMTVDVIKYAQSLSKKEVKGMLTGPVTILNWSFPRVDISLKEMMYQIALAIKEEVLDLQAAGIHIIQIDEAALREKLPLRKADWHHDYLDFAIKAFRLCHSKVNPETQIHTHMCYSEFEDIIKEIDDMDADVITFEAARSKLTILDELKKNDFETEVGPGVYDIHSPRIPSVAEIEAALKVMIEKIPVESLWVNPDCGLKTRGENETVASLINMVTAAQNLRKQLNKN